MKKSNAKNWETGKVTAPKNMTEIDLGGDFGEKFDFTPENNTVEGTILEIRDLPKGGKIKNDTQVMVLQVGKVRKSVWRSTKLEPLFKVAKPGWFVQIQLVGYVKTGHKEPMKDFKAWVKTTK